MKRVTCLLLCAAGLTAPAFSPSAQDDAAARAAAIAEREAAEERYKRLNSAVEGLLIAQADQQRKISALTDEVRNLRADNAKTDTSKYVTREELRKIVEKIQEIDDKREADRKLILAQFEGLEKEIKQLLTAPAAGSVRRNQNRAAPVTEKTEKPADKAADKAAGTQEGVWYVIESGNSLWAIVAAHNEEFKKQGRKTSVKLVEEANPGLKPTSLQVGQKIFIPLVPQ